MNWYEIRVVLERTLSNGQMAKVKEDYLMQAETVTDAENKIIEALKEDIRGEFEIDSVKKKKIAEFFADEVGEGWYRARVNYITINEKTGEEKKQGVTMMVKADDLFDAVDALRKGMQGTMTDWELSGIAETTIINAFFAEEKEETATE